MFHLLRLYVRTRSIVLVWCFLLCSCLFLQAGTIVRETFVIPPIVAGSSLRISLPVFIPVMSQQRNVLLDQVYTSSARGDTSFIVEEWSRRELQADTTINIQITFHPRLVGEAMDSLVIPLPLDTIIVPLSGAGIPLRVSELGLFLGPIEEGRDTVENFRVYNDGNSTVTVQMNKLAPPFYREGEDSLLIPALDSQEVVVHFAPEPRQSMPSEIFFGEISLIVMPGGIEANKFIGIQGVSHAAVTRATIDFVLIGNETSKTAVYAFYNRFQEAISVQVSPLNSGTGFEFLQDFTKPVQVAAGDSLRIPIRFTPNGGTASQTDGFRLLYDSEILLAEINVQGTGLFLRKIDVVADTLLASVGDTVFIPVRFVLTPEMRQIIDHYDPSTLDVVYSVSVDMSMAEVIDEQSIDSVVYNDSSMVVHIGTQLVLPLPETTDTLDIYTLPVRLLLGDIERCPIIIRGMIIRADTTVIFETSAIISDEGRLIADNVFTWPDGQKRLVNVRKGTLTMEISPNPMRDQTQVTVGGFSQGAVVTIYTPLGVELFRRECREPLSFTLFRSDLPGLAPGIYYCRLSSGRYSLVKLLRVE